jgi:hypothetical protein
MGSHQSLRNFKKSQIITKRQRQFSSKNYQLNLKRQLQTTAKGGRQPNGKVRIIAPQARLMPGVPGVMVGEEAKWCGD